jgi:hypothetical protein
MKFGGFPAKFPDKKYGGNTVASYLWQKDL